MTSGEPLIGENLIENLARSIDAADLGIVISEAVAPYSIIYATRKAKALVGGWARDLVGIPLERILPNDATIDDRRGLAEACKTQSPFAIIVADRRRDGTLFWTDLAFHPTIDPDGVIRCFVVVLSDATAKVELQLRLWEAERRLHGVVDEMPSTTYTLRIGRAASSGFTLHMSPQIVALTGKPSESFAEAAAWLSIVDTRDRKSVVDTWLHRARGEHDDGIEYRISGKDGLMLWLRDEATTSIDDEVRTIVGVLSDITSTVANVSDLNEALRRDPLTGLLNRAGFIEKLRAAFIDAVEHGSMIAVGFVDLDKFKEINDTYGHDSGDVVLIEAGRRLESSLTGPDLVAHLSGDEYGMLFYSVEGQVETIKRTDRSILALSEPYLLGGESVKVGASIGISIGPGEERDAAGMAAMMHSADLAMYSIKGDGGGIKVVRTDDVISRKDNPDGGLVSRRGR